MLDQIDKKILKEIQIDSNRRSYQIGKKLNIPRTTVHNRIKKLEKLGYIKGYKAIVDAAKIGKGLTVLIGIMTATDASPKDVAEHIKKMIEVEEIFIVSGQFDLIAKIRVKNTEELAKFVFSVQEGLRSLHGISKTESMVVLRTEKENSVISKILESSTVLNNFAGTAYSNIPKTAELQNKLFVGSAAGFLDASRAFGVKYAFGTSMKEISETSKNNSNRNQKLNQIRAVFDKFKSCQS